MATLNGVHYSNTSGLNLKTSGATQINISTGGVIEFNQAYTFPRVDGSANNVLLTDGNGALSFGTVPNAGLTNSSLTIGSTSISLGGLSTTLAGLTSVAATTFTGALSGNASTASKWASARIITLGTDLSGNVSIDGSANVTLNANIVAGAVGSTELATNAVTTVKITDANVTNAKLANSTITFNVPTGNDPVVSLGGTFNMISSDSSVTISGNSTTDTIDLKVGNSVNTYVTGGTFSSGTLTLGLNDGSSASNITGLWTSIPNSALANSSISIAGTPTSLGGSVTGDDIIAGVSVGQINNSQLINSSITINSTVVPLGGTINVGDINGITAGTGLTGGGTSGTVTVSLDYAGTDNFIDSATNLEGTGIALTDTIIYHDATDNNVKKGLVSDLPYTNSSGTVTSVAISGTDGIDVDSGSPITTSGIITLGLSNVPNSSLANSAVTVTAGNGLVNGGSVSLGGSVTLNVGAGTGISVAADTVGLDTSNTRNVDHASVSISAGTGLSGGGTIAATRTISLDYAGTDNFIDSATNLEGAGIALTDTIIYHDATDNNVKKGLVSDLPYTDNVGTVTSVGITAGALIDVTNSPITSNGNITVAVDLSELTTSTSNADGDFFVVVDSSNNQKKLTKANINNSGFNNDAGYITSAGNTNIYGSDGTLSAARTVTQNGNNLEFKTTGAANTKFRKTTQANRSLTRVMIEADDSYVNVLELDSSAPSTFLVSGYEAGGARVFSVDGQGNLMATSKAFDIPHPNPEKQEQGMRLKHGNLEGPEHGIYIRGRQLNDKEIELPEYWKDLVDPDSITVQLTSVGSHQNLYVKEIKDWVVYIQNGNLFSNKIDCYYFIQAERIDVDRIEVEYYQ